MNKLIANILASIHPVLTVIALIVVSVACIGLANAPLYGGGWVAFGVWLVSVIVLAFLAGLVATIIDIRRLLEEIHKARD